MGLMKGMKDSRKVGRAIEKSMSKKDPNDHVINIWQSNGQLKAKKYRTVFKTRVMTYLQDGGETGRARGGGREGEG